MTTAPATADWTSLRNALAGDLLQPGSPGYDQASQPAIALFRAIRPQAVARCRTPGDVAETIAFARRFRIPAVPRSGGHCFAGRSSSTGIVIDVTPMRSVSVSGDVVTVGAGARLGEVYETLCGHGLAIPAGCGPDVGIAGLTLGGGFGILGRQHGLACDRLVKAEVALADGQVIGCDDRHNEDLFWALRGAGGGHFGVVTSLEFRAVPAPLMTVFHLTWRLANAARLIAAWQDWAPGAPAEMAASLLVTAGSTSGQPRANVFGAMAGAEPDAGRLLGELADRTGTDPASAVSKRLPFREAKQYLAELGDQMSGAAPDVPDGHTFSKSEFFAGPLTAEVIDALVANFGDGGQARELDFSPWAGAYTRVPTDATAFAHRDAAFLLKHAVTVDPGAAAAERAAARRWLATSWELVHPLGTGGVYPNFPDPDLGGWASAYHGGNYARLRQVKARYDPTSFFRFHQSIPPA
jgi:FAD/FMN-containing dehydrogenase